MRTKKNKLEVLHFVGKHYSTRPSSLVGIVDPLAALSFDVAAAKVGSKAEQEAAEKAGKPTGRKPTKTGSWKDLMRKQRR